MIDIAARAALLHRQLDASLIVAVQDSCETAVAVARLDAALDRAVAAIDHPALALERRETGSGHTWSVRFLGRVVMRWCFHREYVDLYCRDGHSTTQLRLRYAPHAGEWRISLPGARAAATSFDDEDEKVLELLEDALRAILPWVGPASVEAE